MPDLSVLDHSVAASRAQFLAEVQVRTPAALRSADFASILDAVISWSVRQGPSLRVRSPGQQHTVSFGVADSDVVLWAAYPRWSDGAKIVILPRSYGRLPKAVRFELSEAVSRIAPSIKITGTELLQVPMHLLSSERALVELERLLTSAVNAIKDNAAGL